MAASCFAALLFTSAVAQPDAVDASADSPAAAAPAETVAPPAEAPPVNEPSATVPAGPTATPVAADADAAVPATEPGVGADAPADSSTAAAEVIATDAVVLPPARPRYNKDDVRWIQQRLQELGYYNGAIDGAYGRVTREAIKSYQIDQELEQDGRPTPELREFMWRNGG